MTLDFSLLGSVQSASVRVLLSALVYVQLPHDFYGTWNMIKSCLSGCNLYSIKIYPKTKQNKTKLLLGRAMMAYTFNPSIWETETGRSL